MVDLPEIDEENFRVAVHYLNEREKIRQRKEKGEDPPYTEDKILRQYKFTNVLRRHDRTTRGLIKHLYKPNFYSPEREVFLNAILARYFGTAEFMQDLGWQEKFDREHILYVVRRRKKNKQRVFTGAYIITNGGIPGPKEEVILDNYIGPMSENLDRLVDIVHHSNRWRDVAEYMYNFKGFGGTGFITKEVLQDVILTPVLAECEDRFTWSPCGPGAARGINRLYGRPYKDRVKKDFALEAMKQLREKFIEEFQPHMAGIAPEFDLHSTQFALCEIDKYLRVKNEEGRPRSLYKPHRDPLP